MPKSCSYDGEKHVTNITNLNGNRLSKLTWFLQNIFCVCKGDTWLLWLLPEHHKTAFTNTFYSIKYSTDQSLVLSYLFCSKIVARYFFSSVGWIYGNTKIQTDLEYANFMERLHTHFKYKNTSDFPPSVFLQISTDFHQNINRYLYGVLKLSRLQTC